MTTNAAEPAGPRPPGHERRETAAEQARRRGIRPMHFIDDVPRDDVFESDEELDAFLAHVYAERHANLT